MGLDLHIGAHKTATTHLQAGLDTARPGLAAAGIACLTPQDLRGGLVRLGRVADRGAGDRARIALAAARAGQPRLLLSDENILGSVHSMFAPDGHLYPEAAARLTRVLDALGGGPVRLWLAVRDPAGLVASAHGQALLAGKLTPFARFAAGIDLARPVWTSLARRLLAVPGVAGLTFWRFEDWPRIAPTVLDALLPQGAAQHVRLPDAPSQPGLSAMAHDWIMHRASRVQDTTAATALARRARARFPKGPGAPGFQPWDDASLAVSRCAHAEDLAGLAEIEGVRALALPVSGG